MCQACGGGLAFAFGLVIAAVIYAQVFLGKEIASFLDQISQKNLSQF